MDIGDLVMLAAIGIGGYLLYQHVQQQQALAAAGGPTGAATGSVVHQCPSGYTWVADSSVTAGVGIGFMATLRR